jgi:hypothetical protein
MDERFNGVASQYDQTFEWLFTIKELGFQEWLQSGRGIFWITGKAGSGKSTLMKYAFSDSRTLQLLKEHDVRGGQPFLAQFFFHGRGTTMQKSFKGLLQTVLYQILERYPNLIPYVLPNHIDKEWRLSTLKESFRKLFTERFDQTLTVCLFVDGLDEFEGDHDEIAEFFLTNIQHSVHRIQICVSSRPLPGFLHHFRTFSRIEMHVQTSNDIKRYVMGKLGETTQMHILRQYQPSEVESFFTTFVNKASGVFLWARLAAKSLLEGLNGGEDLNELYIRLGQLPAELSDLFQTMLDSIDPSGVREAAEILQILSVAKDQPPLHLIYFALDDPYAALDQSGTEFEEQQLKHRCITATLRLRSRCAGLVEVIDIIGGVYNGGEEYNGGVLRVQFLHQSVKDFVGQADSWAFIKARSRPGFSPSRALLAAVLRSIKYVSGWIYGNRGDDFWLKDFGWYASRAEKETGVAQTDMLQELNRVCNARHRRTRRYEAFTNRHWGYSVKAALLLPCVGDRDIPADFHHIEDSSGWTDRFFESLGAPCKQTSLMSYAVWYNIPLTVQAYLQSTAQYSEVLDGLLNLRMQRLSNEDALGCLQTFRSLAQHGANPDADVLGVGESTWQFFLNRLYHGTTMYISWFYPAPELLELFIHSGAGIHATVHIDCEFSCWKEVQRGKWQMSAYSVLRRISSQMNKGEDARMQQILGGLARRGANECVVCEPVPQLQSYGSAFIPDGWPHVLVSVRYRGKCLSAGNPPVSSTQSSGSD